MGSLTRTVLLSVVQTSGDRHPVHKFTALTIILCLCTLYLRAPPRAPFSFPFSRYFLLAEMSIAWLRLAFDSRLAA